MGEDGLGTLQSIADASPLLARVLRDWDAVALPDAWLAAGALAQTVWNHAFGLAPTHGIDDIDIVYFDAGDLSQAAEAAQAARIRAAFADLGVWLDVKNEARVHLWYESRKGYAIAPYRSTPDAIATFPTTATAIGLQPRGESMGLCAPYGLDDLLSGVVRPNKRQITRGIYEAKVARWRPLWPRLTIHPWDGLAGAVPPAGSGSPTIRGV